MSDHELVPMLAPAAALLKCDECGRQVVTREDDAFLGAEHGKFYCCGWCRQEALDGK